MGVIFDTSYLIAVERDAGELPVDEEAGIAAITVSELLQGVLRARGAKRSARQASVEGLLGAVEVIPFDDRVARVHATLWADLERAGRSVGAHDLLIAATAIFRGGPLATLDRRGFTGIPGLQLFGE